MYDCTINSQERHVCAIELIRAKLTGSRLMEIFLHLRIEQWVELDCSSPVECNETNPCELFHISWKLSNNNSSHVNDTIRILLPNLRWTLSGVCGLRVPTVVGKKQFFLIKLNAKLCADALKPMLSALLVFVIIAGFTDFFALFSNLLLLSAFGFLGFAFFRAFFSVYKK